MDLVKGWVINIAIALVFMTAVEMLVLNNSFKKYVKFVLGLILIVVIMTPIINMLGKSQGDLVNTFIQYEQVFNDKKSVTKEVKENTMTQDKIVENIQNNINSLLRDKYSDMDFESKVNGKIDLNKFDISIIGVDIYVYKKGIKPVKKIQIGKSSNNKEESTIKEEEEIKKYISQELKIEKSKINIYSVSKEG